MTDQKDFESVALRAVKNSVASRTNGDKHPAEPTVSADQLRVQTEINGV